MVRVLKDHNYTDYCLNTPRKITEQNPQLDQNCTDRASLVMACDYQRAVVRSTTALWCSGGCPLSRREWERDGSGGHLGAPQYRFRVHVASQ
jgi:hypothetical protein